MKAFPEVVKGVNQSCYNNSKECIPYGDAFYIMYMCMMLVGSAEGLQMVNVYFYSFSLILFSSTVYQK